MPTRLRPLQRHLLVVVAATLALLAVPLAAGWLTPEVNWGGGDFAAAAALLLAAGIGAVVVRHRVRGRRMRALALAAVVLALATVWAELAVGLFD